jgi:hypothetical protein
MSDHPKCGEIVNCVQGDPTWFNERLGSVGASRVAAAVKMLKRGGSSAERENLKMELLTELLTGQAAEHFVSLAMARGIEEEPLARSVYEMRSGVAVERVGLVRHPRLKRAHCSPDGFVGRDGLIEAKCPNTGTHLQYLVAGVVPEEYLPQCHWLMACTGRNWVDFVSFDSRLPEDFNFFTVRLERDEKVIAEMEKQVEQFVSELNALAEKLLKGKTYLTEQLERSVAMGPPRAEIPTEL